MVLAGIFASCNRVPKYDKRLAEVDSIIYDNSGQAKDILLKINPKELNEADEAYYNLLLTQASYINYDDITVDDDSIISQALDYYSNNKGDQEKLTRCNIFKGAVLEELHYPDSAMAYYKWAELNADKNDHFNRGYAQLRMGSLYRRCNAYDGRDIEKYEDAVKSFEKTDKYKYLIVSLRDLGASYRFRNAKKAEENSMKAIELSLNMKDTANFVNSTINLAYLYFMQGAKVEKVSKDSAAKAFNKAYDQLQYIIKYNLLDRLTANEYNTFACVYANTGKIDSASVFLGMARESYGNDSISHQSNTYREAMCQIAKASNKMLEYYKLSHESDSISFSAIMNPVIVDLMNSERDRDNNYTEIQKNNRRKTYYILSGVMLALLLLALWFYRRSHFFDKLVLELKDQSSIQMSKLTDMQQNINEMQINDERLKEFIASHTSMMREMIEACYHEPNNRIAENMKRIVKFQDSNKENWEKLYAYIDLEHNNIMTRTRGQYPQLNDKDMLLLALSCMGYSYIQTAIIMGYSNATSVSVLKQRLAKKMGLDCTLNEYIEQNSDMKIE